MDSLGPYRTKINILIFTQDTVTPWLKFELYLKLYKQIMTLQKSDNISNMQTKRLKVHVSSIWRGNWITVSCASTSRRQNSTELVLCAIFAIAQSGNESNENTRIIHYLITTPCWTIFEVRLFEVIWSLCTSFKYSF